MQAGACSMQTCPSAPTAHPHPLQKLTKEKRPLQDLNLELTTSKLVAQPTQHTGHLSTAVRNVVAIIILSIVFGLRFCRNVGEVLARIVYTGAFEAS